MDEGFPQPMLFTGNAVILFSSFADATEIVAGAKNIICAAKKSNVHIYAQAGRYDGKKMPVTS
jgi:hypothetical protein